MESLADQIMMERHTEAQLKEAAEIYVANYDELKDHEKLNEWIKQHETFLTFVSQACQSMYEKADKDITKFPKQTQEVITKYYLNNKSALHSDAAKEGEQTTETTTDKTPMTAAKCYKILTQGTDNDTEFLKAADYYTLHLKEMDTGYPLMRSLMKRNESINKKMTDYVNKHYSNDSAADLSRANSMSERERSLLTDFSNEIKYEITSNGAGAQVKTSDAYAKQKTESDQKAVSEEISQIAEDFKFTLDEYVTPQEQFKLPDMGDYYLGDVDTTFLELIDQAMRDKKNAQKAANYASKAPEQSLGYNEKKGTYFLKCFVDLNTFNAEDGWFDENHITLSIDNMTAAEDDTTGALSKLKERVERDIAQYPLLQNDLAAAHMIDLQILGINGPTGERWATEKNIPVSHLNLKRIELETYYKNTDKENENYVFDMDFLYSQADFDNLTEDELVERAIDSYEPEESSPDKNGKTTYLPIWKYFMYLSGKFHEIEITSGDVDNAKSKISFKWLVNSGTQGFESYLVRQAAIDKMKQYIQQANGIIYVRIDETGLEEGSNKFQLGTKGMWANETKRVGLIDMAEQNSDLRFTGYNRIAMERSRRFLGEVYLKAPNELSDEVYINLSKVLANDEDINAVTQALMKNEENEPINENDSKLNANVTYSTDYEGDHSSAFDMNGYDINARAYADAFFETMSSLDDRPEIQKDLLGLDWVDLPDYNVILGDVSFFVPPTNIAMQTYTQSDRLPIIRAKGSAAKTESHMKRILQLQLYFNEDRGINGAPYIVELPNGTKTAYSMNGLRAIMSMFRFTPYLPITNRVVNKVYGIDAVSLQGMNIQSVPNYPKLIQVTLTMCEFQWSVYAPDIYQMSLMDTSSSLTLKEQLENDNTIAYWNRSDEEKAAEKAQRDELKTQLEKEHIQNVINGVEDNYEQQLENLNSVQELTLNKESYKNWFAALFNWKTFRYYYQRPIIRGNVLKCVGWDFNSDNYIAATCGALTSFVPMSFQDPHIKFYMASEDYLQEIYQKRMSLLSGNTEIKFNPNQLDLLHAYGKVYTALQDLQKSDEFVQKMNKLNEHVKSLVDSKTYAGMFTDAQDVINSYQPLDEYNKGQITNDLGFTTSGMNSVNDVLHSIDDALEPLRIDYNNFFEQDMEYISYLNGTDGIVVYGIALTLKEDALDNSELKGFMDNVSNYMQADIYNDRVKDYDITRIFASENNRIVIPLTILIKEWKSDGTLAETTINETIARQARLYNQAYPNPQGTTSAYVAASSYVLDYYTPQDDAIFEIFGESGAMKFLAAAEDLANHYEELNAKGGYTESVPDVNNLMNLVYEAYDIGEPLVLNWQASFSNNFANLRILETDGDAPQYMGGSDVSVNLIIKTQDETTARKLADIPKQISRLTRRYHMVMPCVPLRVDSEFTRFLGVNEVTVENATIMTTDDYPGLFTVSMELISLDRTVREREAAVRRAAHNDGWNKDTSSAFRSWWDAEGNWLDVVSAMENSMDEDTARTFGSIVSGSLMGAGIGAGASALGLTALGGGAAIAAGTGIGLIAGVLGATVLAAGHGIYREVSDSNAINAETDDFGDGKENTRRINQYFELKKALAENDLYPDLELPTIEEMKNVGYYFVRYNFDDERVYVDPDFYFVYPVALQSHIYREMIIHGMDNNFADTKLTDATGACVTVTPSKTEGYKVIESNNIAKNQQEIARKRRLAQEQLAERNTREQEDLQQKQQKSQDPRIKMTIMLNKMMERDSWKVCDKINCMFLEKRFKKELDSYLAAQNVIAADQTDSNHGTSNANNAAETEAATAEENSVGEEDTQSTDTAVTRVITEGAHVYTRLQSAQEAADTFLQYLIETPIEKMSTVIPTTLEWQNRDGNNALTDIGNSVSTFLELDPVRTFLTDLKVEITDEFKTCVATVIKAAACHGTGHKEYSAKNSGDWKPKNSFIGQVAGLPGNDHLHSVMVDTAKIHKEGKDPDLTDKINQVILCGLSFGVFGIKMYSPDQIHQMLTDSTAETFNDVNTVEVSKDYDQELLKRNVNVRTFLLDPYYRKGSTPLATIEKYKKGCICSVVYCTFAYMRLVFYWLYRLVKRYAIPTISIDSFSDTVRMQQEITEAQKEWTGTGEVLIKKNDGDYITFQKYVDFFQKDVVYTHVGKLWTAAILASSNGDIEILKRIDNRDYDALNSIVQSCASVKSEIDVKGNVAAIAIRKMVLALIGLKMITSMNAIGVNQAMPNIQSARNTQQRLYLAAAEDPKQYIPHSYHDMVVNDARGRMLRAFPTFYMCFIDEGREIGFWKLHDNFYNTSSIVSIEVIKSRKLPADTCKIQMSNFYNSYTTEAEDYIRTQIATIDQAWDSLFSPSNYFAYMEGTRRNKPMEIRLRLRQGARIHVRMGYGNNAAMLPIVFNGVITEVDSMDTVNIIAQGDGWELTNPIQIDKQVHNLSHQDEWFDSFDNADTPLQIATALFNTHGGKMSTITRETFELNLGDRNPFGIIHFGNPDFKTFVKCGEACQNLYEAMTRPVFGGNIDVKNEQYDNYVSDNVPQITFDMFQKTPWDVLNICKSISPDFRLGVVPFGFRSTVFMGSPHYYMCYDYFKDIDGVIKEKRKPFQQWHIYTSSSDIIGNGIVATARDMHNVAMGMYTVCESLNIESQETVGPLFADRDIYPDSQRTMIVDTSLLGKGPAFVGVITNSIAQRLENNFNNFGLVGDTGPITNHKKVAWRATASALREGVMDMYAGDLIIMGDPSVKPQDRFYMKDSYTGINGQALVKEVVYRLSYDTGFITTISPDCIACVNDNTEIVKTMFNERVGAIASTNDEVNHNIEHYLKRAAGEAVFGFVGGRVAGWLTKNTAEQKAREALSAAKSKLSKFAVGSGAYIRQLKIVDQLKETLKGYKAISVVGNAIKGAATALRGLGLLGMLGAAGGGIIGFFSGGGIIAAAATVASFLIMPFVNTFLEEELKNYKVIKIYPLKKWGYVYTAGFEGARGTVYGSPTWGDRGTLGDIFDAIQDKCPIAGVIGEFIFSEEVNNLASQYLKDNNIINADGTAAQMETAYGNFSGHLAGDNYTYQYTDYRSQQLTPRATLDNPTALRASINYYQMTDIQHYKTDPKLREMHLISQEARLKPYIDEQFFLIVHEDPGMETGIHAHEERLVIGGNEYDTKYYNRKDKNGNPVIDIPLLTQDAMNILVEIIVRARSYVPSSATSDPNENIEILRNSYITLRSALCIGDQVSMASTGFTFILKGTDELSQKALKAALESLHDELTNDDAKSLGLQTKVFDYQEQDNQEVAIIVYPPEIRKGDTRVKRGATQVEETSTEETTSETVQKNTKDNTSETTSDNKTETKTESEETPKEVEDNTTNK